MARPVEMEKRVAFAFYLDYETAERLRALSKETDVPVSAIIRNIVRDELNQRSPGSVPAQMP